MTRPATIGPAAARIPTGTPWVAKIAPYARRPKRSATIAPRRGDIAPYAAPNAKTYATIHAASRAVARRAMPEASSANVQAQSTAREILLLANETNDRPGRYAMPMRPARVATKAAG